jgi:hypothetical protein
MKKVMFSSKKLQSLLRNGLSKTTGVSLLADGSAVRIEAINSKGLAVNGWIEIENDCDTLRDIARALKELAAEVDPENELKGAYMAACESKDLEFEIDDNCDVSISSDGGAYVQGWKWVPAGEAFTPDELAEYEIEGETPTECAWCHARNIAHEGDGVWECHDCGREFDMRDTGLDAEGLKAKYSDEHPLAAKGEWHAATAGGKTEKGYWEWAEAMLSDRLGGLV